MDNAPDANQTETVTPDAPVDSGTGSTTTDSPATPGTSTDAPHTGTDAGTPGEVAPSAPSSDSVVVGNPTAPNPDEFQYVFPIEWREHTSFTTGQGIINVVNEITLGDLLISTLLMALIVWQVASRLIRR